MKRTWINQIIRWGLMALFCGVIAYMAFQFVDINGAQREEQLFIQQRAIERAAVMCYALEGSFPPNVVYLEDNYGLIIDRNKFIVRYTAYGSNIKPDIRVFHAFGD
jgi:hypothetical protein